MSRIVAGELGGRRLRVPQRGTRPTSERVREALFSALEHTGAVADARVLDLYAGSGALGLEALSRGAATAVLVESAPAAAALCRQNAADLGLAARVQVVTARAAAYVGGAMPSGGFHLILADPPYEIAEAEAGSVLPALAGGGWLAPDGVIAWEQPARAAPPAWPQPWQDLGRRVYGESALCLAERPAGGG